jgi:hypothetical protein
MNVRLLYASVARIGNRARDVDAGNWQLILAVAIEERLEGTAQLRREVGFVDRVEQRHGGLIGLELCDAAGARSQVPLQCRVYRRRQMMFHEVRQEAHEIGAAAFF